MRPLLAIVSTQTRTHVSRPQHRPTSQRVTERTEPRRSHPAFHCYSVKRLFTTCVARKSPVTILKTNFVCSFDKKIVVMLNLKCEEAAGSNLLPVFISCQL